MAIPKQVGVLIESKNFQFFEICVSFVCMVLFLACFRATRWAEEGIIPFFWHEFGCEIAVFCITLSLTSMGMAAFDRCRSQTLVEDNEEQSERLSGTEEARPRQRKRWFHSFLCIGSSPLEEPEAEPVNVGDFNAEKTNL